MVRTSIFALAIGSCLYHVHAGITSSYSRGPGPDVPLPLDHKLLNPSPGAVVEQVHVTGGNPDSAFITWVTNNSASPSKVVVDPENKKIVFKGSKQVISVLLDPSPYYPVPVHCLGGKNYTNPECYYTSGVIHTVEVTGLEPATKYQYSIEGISSDGSSHTSIFSFTTSPAVGPSIPITFGVVGDLGQTLNSSHTLDGLRERVSTGEYQMILHAGDLSYADGYGPRWDTYARMGQDLWSSVPTAHVGGNHEVSSGGENWLQYQARYPNPHQKSNSDSFLWYSLDTGCAHVIMLCSYAAFDTNSLQYQWLAEDLAKVNRSNTPWIIAVWHTPWYTSNAHHPMKEGAEMKTSMEELLYKYKVNVVINGHVHAYERSHAVYMNKVTTDGIVHITIGDGGNREMFAKPWVDPQPDWSALREDAYGHGSLKLVNSTHARWQWLRNKDPWNVDPSRILGDDIWITRN